MDARKAAIADLKKLEPLWKNVPESLDAMIALLASKTRFEAKTNSGAIIFEVMEKHGLARRVRGLTYELTSAGKGVAASVPDAAYDHARDLAEDLQGHSKGRAMRKHLADDAQDFKSIQRDAKDIEKRVHALVARDKHVKTGRTKKRVR